MLYLTDFALVFILRNLRLCFEFITVPETLFYLLVYLSKSNALQKPAAEGTSLSAQKRKDLLTKCWSSVPDMEYFVKTWFRGAPADEIKRENVKDWLAWGFLNKYSYSQADEGELEGYLSITETALGKKFDEGRGPHGSLRPTFDPISIQHRPLSYYICGVGLMDSLVFLKMWRMGFRHYAIRNIANLFPTDHSQLSLATDHQLQN